MKLEFLLLLSVLDCLMSRLSRAMKSRWMEVCTHVSVQPAK